MPKPKNDTDKINDMVNELESLPNLVLELNEKFSSMDGVLNKDEFSRCIVFFMLGRLYERKIN